MDKIRDYTILCISIRANSFKGAGAAAAVESAGKFCTLDNISDAVSVDTAAEDVTTMQIAANKESQRAPNEVVYYGQYGEDPYKPNVTRMDSNGGWIASSTEMVQFLNHIAGAPGIPSLLKPETIRQMTTPAPASPPEDVRYARGWMVRNNGAGNWWHNGSLPGTGAIMVRTSTGFCWAALLNSRSQPSNEMGAALDKMMWNVVRCVPSWGA